MYNFNCDFFLFSLSRTIIPPKYWNLIISVEFFFSNNNLALQDQINSPYLIHIYWYYFCECCNEQSTWYYFNKRDTICPKKIVVQRSFGRFFSIYFACIVFYLPFAILLGNSVKKNVVWSFCFASSHILAKNLAVFELHTLKLSVSQLSMCAYWCVCVKSIVYWQYIQSCLIHLLVSVEQISHFVSYFDNYCNKVKIKCFYTE